MCVTLSCCHVEGQVWFSGESCLIELLGLGIEAVFRHLREKKKLASVYPFPKPHSSGSLRH
jgi:hypothetical protein